MTKARSCVWKSRLRAGDFGGVLCGRAMAVLGPRLSNHVDTLLTGPVGHRWPSLFYFFGAVGLAWVAVAQVRQHGFGPFGTRCSALFHSHTRRATST